GGSRRKVRPGSAGEAIMRRLDQQVTALLDLDAPGSGVTLSCRPAPPVRAARIAAAVSGGRRDTMEHVARQSRAVALGPRFAADVVAMAREGARVRLDYSPDSLALVDRVIESIRREKPPAAAITPTLLGFGAYTGQVLVREAGAEWVDFDPVQRDMFGQRFGVKSSDGRVWNPLGRAIKRYENGMEDSLRLFYLSVVGRAQV
ncbi:hypothetical protein ABZ901_34870, partial [Actinacidiphila alni]|uniref:hypothetical protein n=1 Tax=Actinacidiphila alni TaxID=380248 RepID=UPI0034014AD2